MPLLFAFFLLLAAAPAHADRVLGRFTYQDYGDGQARPINDAKVEIWRYKPGLFGVWGWSMDKRLWTNFDGVIDTDVPSAGAGVVYALRVYAANAHITVWPHDTAHVGESWWNEPPQQTAPFSGATLDFTHHFTAWHAARNYNIARVGWLAGEYMVYTYGRLPTVNAQTTELYPGSFYEPVGDTIQMRIERDFHDRAIAHEYGHFIEEQIGSLPWRPERHSLCGAMDPALAWMEGFAGYFPYAVARMFPGELTNLDDFSVEPSCSGDPQPRESVEGIVASVLFDLMDTGSGGFSVFEPHDQVSNQEWLILSIIDDELGGSGATPTIWNFRDAWAGRGMPLVDLDRIYAAHGLLPHFNLSQFSSQSVPSTMIAGHSYPVRVVLRNNGSKTWWPSSGYRLGSQNPQDNTRWGMHRVALPGGVAPGQYATFDFTVTAPSTPGSYPFQWRMVQDNVEWFGDFTPSVQVAVTAAAQSARFDTQAVPTSMTADSYHAVSVTMTNTGETTWYPGTYFLGSQNPQDNFTWGMNRVALPHAVGPGGQVTFHFNVSAPGSGGTFNFQWRMLQDGVGWFGDATPNVAVYVNPPAPTCDGATCTSDCLDMGCRGGSCTSTGSCRCVYCR